VRLVAGGHFAEYYELFTGEPLGSMRQSPTAAVVLDWLCRLPTPSDLETSDRQQDRYRLRRARFRAEKEPEAGHQDGRKQIRSESVQKDVLMIGKWPSGASEAVLSVGVS